jgi:hypothetical protein
VTQRAELCANYAALSRSALSLTRSGQKAAGYLSSRLEMAGYGCEEVAETSGPKKAKLWTEAPKSIKLIHHFR